MNFHDVNNDPYFCFSNLHVAVKTYVSTHNKSFYGDIEIRKDINILWLKKICFFFSSGFVTNAVAKD